ncbi:MAG: tetratricopeptide repeat protein [Pseudomonadota bacterium]
MNDNSEDLRSAVHEISELLDRHRLASARAALERALPQHPDDPELILLVAWLSWYEDDAVEARRIVQRILQMQPEHREAQYLLSRIEFGEENYAEAERLLIGLLKRYPESPSLYASYAEVMLETLNTEKAEQLAVEALRLDPQNESALNIHTLCGFVQSGTEEQRERLQKLLREYPDQTQTTIRLIQHLSDNGQTKEAYKLSKELVVNDPSNQGLVEFATTLRRASHWSMLPLWPMQKWGWAGSIGIWVATVVFFGVADMENSPLQPYAGTVAIVLIGYVVYSWVWPPILQRLIR